MFPTLEFQYSYSSLDLLDLIKFSWWLLLHLTWYRPVIHLNFSTRAFIEPLLGSSNHLTSPSALNNSFNVSDRMNLMFNILQFVLGELRCVIIFYRISFSNWNEKSFFSNNHRFSISCKYGLRADILICVERQSAMIEMICSYRIDICVVKFSDTDTCRLRSESSHLSLTTIFHLVMMRRSVVKLVSCSAICEIGSKLTGFPVFSVILIQFLVSIELV